MDRILRGNPLFEHLTDEELHTVYALLERKEYDAGREIFDESMPGRELYMIVQGKVRIAKGTKAGERQTLSVLSTGSFFGELSLLDGRKHSAAAEAVEPTVLLVLTRETMARLEKEHPRIALVILKNMALKMSSILREMNEKFMGMVNYLW